jgi:hypothetical protein
MVSMEGMAWMIARRLGLAGLVGVCALAGILVPGVAHADMLHPYLSTPSSEITAGVRAGTKVGSAEALTGPVYGVNQMTIDSGHLWLAEFIPEGELRVDEFDAATGAFVSQLPSQPPGVQDMGILGIAVGHEAGKAQIYLGAAEHGEGRVIAVSETGALLSTWTGSAVGGFGEGEGAVNDVAVDDNTEPLVDAAAGDLYVVDGKHQVVDVFKSEADGQEPSKAMTQLTGTCPAAETTCAVAEVIPFNDPLRVAVDAGTGEVLVLDAYSGASGAGVVDIFRPEPFGGYEFVRSITGPSPSRPFGQLAGGHASNIGVDSADGEFYVAEVATHESVVDEFSAAGAFLGDLTGANTSDGGFRYIESIAVDPGSHDLYVGDNREAEIEAAQPSAVYVFGAGVLVPDVATDAASGEDPTGATLHGEVNPLEAQTGEAATCQFVWGPNESLGHTDTCSEEVKGSSFVKVERSLTGLQPHTTYYYRLQASNGKGSNLSEQPSAECNGVKSEDACFTTTGPGIGEQFVTDVSSSSATLNAAIDPNNVTTSYRFEYDTHTYAPGEAPHGLSVPLSDEVAGSGASEVKVSQHVQGLSADTLYHYRVVTLIEREPGKFEEFDGAERTFTTRATGEFALPDARQWQLVSPLDKHGALIEPIGEAWAIQAAAGGGAFTYVTDAPTESEPVGYDNLQQVLSTRGVAGWFSRNIALPHDYSTGLSVGKGMESRFFSEDLAQGIVQPFGPFVACHSAEGVEQPCLSSQASEQTAFLRNDYVGGSSEPCSSSCYTPLVTGAEGYADVPLGTVFGQGPEGRSCPPDFECGPQFVDATPDLHHVLLRSPVRLTKEAASEGGLYEWSAEAPAGKQLQLVTAEGSLPGSSRHAISNDGSRVVWENNAHLFMTDLVKHETVQLDSGLPIDSTFQTASSNLSKVFFTSAGHDLYEYDVELHDLLRVTENADVLGLLPGASEDGSWVYFVANGVLGDGGEHGAVPGNCSTGEQSATNTCNLYVLHGGTTKLVAVLSGGDVPDWSGRLSGLTARVSPNGEWLAFMSQRNLTGYDNLDASSDKPDEEVYEYDAATGALACASCDPTGARPHGVEYGLEGGVTPNLPLVGGDQVWDSTTWLAANIPGWTPYKLSEALYQSRYLSDSGRLFFNSSDGLVPKDVNGQEDVYEFEPQGVPTGEHACSSASASGGEVFKAERGFEVAGVKGVEGAGCVALISSGSSAQESAFLDASESGGDVFFMTTAKLAPQDFDNALDVYDAHECTAQSPCLPEPAEQPPACTTEASCLPAPSSQPALFGLSGSATFSGSGNVSPPAPVSKAKTAAQLRAEKLADALKACRRDKSKRKRAVCEKQAKRRYGVSKAAKRTGNKRRAK